MKSCLLTLTLLWGENDSLACSGPLKGSLHGNAHQQTHSQTHTHTHTHTQEIATSLMHFSQWGKPKLRASTVLCPCAAVSTVSRCLLKRMHDSACPSFLQTGGLVVQTRRMWGLPSNAVLMVSCVVGRERHAATQRNSSDFPEHYIMVSFCWGGLVTTN